MNKGIGIFLAVALFAAAAAAAADRRYSVPKESGRPWTPPPSGVLGADPGCAGAPTLTVTAGLDTVLAGDTTGGTSNVEYYGCVGWNESGPEGVLLLDIPEPVTLHLKVESAADLDLFLLSGCDSDLCEAWHVREFVVEVPGGTEPWVAVVDGYLGAAGPYTLEVAAYAVGVPAGVCDTATPLPCTTAGTSVQGNIYGQPNLLLGADCADYLEWGGETWYSVETPDSVLVRYELHDQAFDGALWLFDGCDASAVCVGFADAGTAGQPETIQYQNLTGATRTYYLAVDAFTPPESSAGGGFLLDVTCTGNVVPVRRTGWGAFKSLYR